MGNRAALLLKSEIAIAKKLPPILEWSSHGRFLSNVRESSRASQPDPPSEVIRDGSQKFIRCSYSAGGEFRHSTAASFGRDYGQSSRSVNPQMCTSKRPTKSPKKSCACRNPRCNEPAPAVTAVRHRAAPVKTKQPSQSAKRLITLVKLKPIPCPPVWSRVSDRVGRWTRRLALFLNRDSALILAMFACTPTRCRRVGTCAERSGLHRGARCGV